MVLSSALDQAQVQQTLTLRRAASPLRGAIVDKIGARDTRSSPRLTVLVAEPLTFVKGGIKQRPISGPPKGDIRWSANNRVTNLITLTRLLVSPTQHTTGDPFTFRYPTTYYLPHHLTSKRLQALLTF